MLHPTTSWHNLYPTTPASTWVAEAPVSWHRSIPEKLVRCLWFDQRWRPVPLCTLDGREITVHSPGRWNLQAGPDFQQASIAFVDGARQRGDVEIHRYASGWIAHRHHLDPRYNDVILHVFLWNDRQTPEVTILIRLGTPTVGVMRRCRGLNHMKFVISSTGPVIRACSSACGVGRVGREKSD